MVLMAAVDNDRHRVAKHSSAPPAPAQLPSSRTRLHGFSFPTLSWGTHRLLRCTKTGAASAPPTVAPDNPSPDNENPHRPEGGGGGASLQRQRAPQRPWNLRTRRAATAAPPRPVGSDDAEEEGAAERAPAPAAESKKRGFAIALSKQEIAEDFAAIRGTRPPRRPKKRPRAVQRQVDVRIETCVPRILFVLGAFLLLGVSSFEFVVSGIAVAVPGIVPRRCDPGLVQDRRGKRPLDFPIC